MPQPRKSQISLIDTPYYHCVSRCVRRSFLCGQDKFTGQSYEHRRGWVEERLLFLSSVFAIDISAYAVMSNHTHVVLHVDETVAQSWSMEEVVRRWHQLHKGTLLTNNRHSASFSGFKLFFLRASLANPQTHRVLPVKFFSSNVRIAKPAGSTARHTPD
jgi:hypothetical protein